MARVAGTLTSVGGLNPTKLHNQGGIFTGKVGRILQLSFESDSESLQKITHFDLGKNHAVSCYIFKIF
jgi:hypothetical protein